MGHSNEWGAALDKMGQFIEAFKLGERSDSIPDFLSFIQFSTDVHPHIIGVITYSL